MTAKRVYSQNLAPTYTPATKRGTWGSSGTTRIFVLSENKNGASSSGSSSETSTSATYTVLVHRFVTDAGLIRTAGNLAGSMNWAMGLLQSAAAMNAYTHLYVYVTVGDTDVVRGVLLADWDGSTTWPTTSAGLTEGPVAISTVAVQPGDRIIIEAGYQARNTVATSYAGTIRFGGNSTTDLFNGDTVTSHATWFEFSDDNNLMQPVPTVPPAQNTTKAYVRDARGTIKSSGTVTVKIPPSLATDGQLMVQWNDDSLVLAGIPAGSGWVASGASYSVASNGIGQVYRRQAPGSAVETTESWTAAGGSSLFFCFTIANCDPTSDANLFDVMPSWVTNAASTAVTMPTVAPSTGRVDDLAISCCYSLVNYVGSNPYTTPSGMFEWYDMQDAPTPYISGDSFSQQLTSATATGARASTQTQGVKGLGMSMAIKSVAPPANTALLYPFLHAGS